MVLVAYVECLISLFGWKIKNLQIVESHACYMSIPAKIQFLAKFVLNVQNFYSYYLKLLNENDKGMKLSNPYS